MPAVDEAAIRAALATVKDPEIGRPIDELNMVDSVSVDPVGVTTVRILLTVAGCPMKAKLCLRTLSLLFRPTSVCVRLSN